MISNAYIPPLTHPRCVVSPVCLMNLIEPTPFVLHDTIKERQFIGEKRDSKIRLTGDFI
jgi:hypothetical protein